MSFQESKESKEELRLMIIDIKTKIKQTEIKLLNLKQEIPQHIPLDAGRVPLGGKRGNNRYALVDPQFVDKLTNSKWHVDSSGYVKSTKFGRIHQIVMQLAKSSAPIDKPDIDHVNHDKFDNRLSNLRWVSKLENNQNTRLIMKTNTSGHTGVSYDKNRRKWLARFRRNGIRLIDKHFGTKEEAIAAVEEISAKWEASKELV